MSVAGLAKKLLVKLYLASLRGHNTTLPELAEDLGLSVEECREIASRLAEEGLVEVKDVPGGPEAYELTQDGRSRLRVVMTGGVFDILHVGHLATLEAARALGDVLVVVVARDETVLRLKGRKPLNGEEDRLRLVSALKMVDIALLGDPEDPYKTVELIRPDIIALGYDQKHDEGEITRSLRKRGLLARVVRLDVKVPGVKSSRILNKLLQEI